VGAPCLGYSVRFPQLLALRQGVVCVLELFSLEWGEYVLVLFSLFVVVILAGAPAYPLCLAAALRRLEGGGSQWGFPLVRPAPAVVSLRSSCRVRGTVWVC
jgi:hypothetical protein